MTGNGSHYWRPTTHFGPTTPSVGVCFYAKGGPELWVDTCTPLHIRHHGTATPLPSAWSRRPSHTSDIFIQTWIAPLGSNQVVWTRRGRSPTCTITAGRVSAPVRAVPNIAALSLPKGPRSPTDRGYSLSLSPRCPVRTGIAWFTACHVHAHRDSTDPIIHIRRTGQGGERGSRPDQGTSLRQKSLAEACQAIRIRSTRNTPTVTPPIVHSSNECMTPLFTADPLSDRRSNRPNSGTCLPSRCTTWDAAADAFKSWAY